MRPTFLKASSLEPNFSFGSPTPVNRTVVASSSPESIEARSEHSDVVLHKVDPNLFNYRGSCVEGISLARGDNILSVHEKVNNHCRSKWGLYVIIAFGIISISACIAAGIALSAVQPLLVDSFIDPQYLPEETAKGQIGRPIFASTTPVSPNILSYLFSTIREAGMREMSLELRNGTSTMSPHSPSVEMINAVVESDTPVVYVVKATTTEKPMIVYSDIAEREKMPPSYNPIGGATTFPVQRHMLPRVFHIDDNREPDRFPERNLVLSDPKYHDLNITFDGPFQVPQPMSHFRRRNVMKRSANYIHGQTKRFPIIKFGRYTIMHSTTKSADPAPLDITTNYPIVDAKALLPMKPAYGECEVGFEWNSQRCVDVDECLQLGIRACGVHSECTNTPGSFTCRCNPGFRIDAKSLVCLDIDECKESNGECSPLAMCENLPGGFICKCRDGFYGNGIVCEIDGSGIADVHDTKQTTPCQTVFPPRLHQTVSNPYFPEPYPKLSRYKFCIEKLHAACKTGITIKHFVPSTTSHQDYDYIRVSGKIFTGTDLNGQTVWLLDSRNVPIDIEFSTDSDIKGNRFTMEVAQEICGPLLTVPECSDLLKVQKKTISSSTPHYIDNIHCTTALYPPSEACGMELTFQEFSLEGPRETCPYDYLEINDDKLCGNMKNELREVIFPRNTPKIPIIFSTDSTFVSRGFNITFTWITECFS